MARNERKGNIMAVESRPCGVALGCCESMAVAVNNSDTLTHLLSFRFFAFGEGSGTEQV